VIASRPAAVRHKPRALCEERAEPGGARGPGQRVRIEQLERRFARLGLRLRAPGIDDVPAIEAFLATRFSSPALEMVTAYDLYRFVRFGHPLLLEDGAGRIVASLLECTYGDAESTSYCVSLAVAEELAGRRLGADLVTHSALAASLRGCGAQRAVLAPHNHASLVTFINLCGHSVEAVYPRLAGFGAARLAIARPLDGDPLVDERIDRERLRGFVEGGEAGVDYALIPAHEPQRLCQLYESTPFQVVAFLAPERHAEDAWFVAVPPPPEES